MARRVVVVAVVEHYVQAAHSFREGGQVLEARIRKALSKEGLFEVETTIVIHGSMTEELVEHLRGNL